MLQNAAAATVDRDYSDNLKRLETNLQKHISAGDDDEVHCPRAIGALDNSSSQVVFQDSVAITTICPVSRAVMTVNADGIPFIMLLSLPRLDTCCSGPAKASRLQG